MTMPTMRMRVLDRLLLVSAIVLLGAVFLAAARDASQAWDVWYYHLPFAARLLGIVSADEYVFSSGNAARFAGFPLGGEILQGVLWRITGRAESANLVAFASVPLFAGFLRRKLAIAWHHAVLALFAVPLVMTHASSAYVDLPANVCAAALVLTVACASMKAPDAKTVLAAAAFAIGAAHMRFQLAPLVFVSLGALVWFARGRERLMIAAAAPVVFAWPLKNLLVHGNPAYPVALKIGSMQLPGIDPPYSSSPTWLEKWPAPVRFVASVLELGARPLADARRWSVDQWTPPDHDGYRMGGFFGAYVVVLVLAAIVFTLRSRAKNETRRRSVTLAKTMAALTLVVAASPQSHELRYYLVWMLVLVATAIVAVPPSLRTALAMTCAGFVVTVIAVTRGAYVMPSGESVRELVERHVSPASVSSRKDGERVCIARAPWTFLHAARFHPPRRYVVVEGEDDGTCAP